MILFAVEAKDWVLRVADFLEGLKDAEVDQDGTLKDQRRRLEGGGEWEPIKIHRRNSPYILKSTRHPSLLTRPRPHSYKKAIGHRNRVRNYENTAKDDNQYKQSQVRDYDGQNQINE
jgi:hypothetical protein